MLLFWLVCIPVRVMMATVVHWLGRNRHRSMWWLGVLLGIVALGWTSFAATVPPARQTGAFGGKVWWSGHRAVHIALIALSSVACFLSPTFAWVPLAFSVALGVGARIITRV